MKNVKLTIASTLSVLALSFTATASAKSHNFDGYSDKKVSTKNLKASASKRSAMKTIYQAKRTKQLDNKRVVTKKVVVKNNRIKKAQKARYIAQKQAVQAKKYNQRVNSKKRYSKVVTKAPVKRAVYSVRSGDTLFKISTKTGVSVKTLARLNRINQYNVNLLQIGQVLRLV